MVKLHKLLENAKGEWGLKAVALLGVWFIGPIYGNLEFNFDDSLVLVLLTVGIIFANKIYDDFISPSG